MKRLFRILLNGFKDKDKHDCAYLRCSLCFKSKHNIQPYYHLGICKVCGDRYNLQKHKNYFRAFVSFLFPDVFLKKTYDPENLHMHLCRPSYEIVDDLIKELSKPQYTLHNRPGLSDSFGRIVRHLNQFQKLIEFGYAPNNKFKGTYVDFASNENIPERYIAIILHEAGQISDLKNHKGSVYRACKALALNKSIDENVVNRLKALNDDVISSYLEKYRK